MSVIYSPHFMRQASKAQDMKRKYVPISVVYNVIHLLINFVRISGLYETVTRTKIPPHVRSLTLDMLCDDLEGNDVDDVPYIKYTFR